VRDKASSVKNPGRHRQSNCVDPPTSSRELFPTHGTGATDCTGQNVSTGHGAHASLLIFPLKKPAAHGAHTDASKKKPGAHRHSANATRATAVVLVLTGHALHVAFPSAGLYLPRAHGAHSAEVLLNPASHAHASTLDALAGSGTREFAGHAAHETDVWLRYWPSGHETHVISTCAVAGRAPHSHAPHTASAKTARDRRRMHRETTARTPRLSRRGSRRSTRNTRNT